MSALAGFRVLAGTAFVFCTAGLLMNDMRWAAAGLAVGALALIPGLRHRRSRPR